MCQRAHWKTHKHPCKAAIASLYDSLAPLAEAGDVVAQFWLGFAHRHGHGVSQSYPDALIWLRRAAGHAEALFELSCCFYNGEGDRRAHV